MILCKKVIQPCHLESNLLRSHKLCHLICQASLKDFFMQVPDRTFPNLIREFYQNLKIVGTSLRSIVSGVEIYIHKDNFGRIFELPFEGKTYTHEMPLGFRNFKHSITLITLLPI